MDIAVLTETMKRIAGLPDGAPASNADAAVLEQALSEYPAAIAPAILLLRHTPEEYTVQQTKTLQEIVALGTSSANTLSYAAHGEEWANFYPEQEHAPTQATEDVIDTFLNTYGNCSPEEERLLEQMIFNPAPDYAELLARQEQEQLPPESEDGEPDSQQARINAFIRSQHPAAHTTAEPDNDQVSEEEHPANAHRPETSDSSLLSESLAKIFVKQGRYERAYEIISGLSLKFPKKSAYFADQLRFLQKLIINQRCLAASKGQDAE